MEIVPYGGWERCARLISGETELIVTLEVGPRVIRYGFIGGPNMLFENPKEMGLTGGDDYRSYGGHRLWIAPEDMERTYTPENEAVEFGVSSLEFGEACPITRDDSCMREGVGGGSYFRSAVDRYGLQKEIRIFSTPLPPSSSGTNQPDEEGGFRLEHIITNNGERSIELAPWALTVMAPGGECIFPQTPHQPHGENFLPVRPLVLWAYTDMSDPRWTWGRRVVRLRHDPNGGPQKVGALVRQGYAAYANAGLVFVKRFACMEGATYPDMGCNFETFTNRDMLEVESLGPLVSLQPGESTSHVEEWTLAVGTPPTSDEDCAAWLKLLTTDH